MSPKQLTLQNIHGTDPIARIAFKRMKLSPLSTGLFFLLTTLLYAIILPYFWGYPLTVNGNDIIYLFLVFPVAGFFYAYQPTRIIKTYESVMRFLHGEEQGHIIHHEKIVHMHNSRALWIIGLLFGLMGAWFGITYSIAHFGEYWYSTNWFQILFVYLVRFLAFYCIGVVAARHIVTSIELNQLFENADFPLTLDADRLDVFRSVKNFALEFVGAAALIALNLGLQPLMITPPILEYSIYVGLYFIIAPFSFFLPIWGAHRRMVQIKTEVLDRLHYDYQEESQRLYRDLNRDGNTSTEYVNGSEKLLQLDKMIEAVAKTLVWPFEGTTVYRLAATVISPFLLIIFDIFINIVSNLVVPN